MEDVTSNKRKMQELEDNLLFRLTSTQVGYISYLLTCIITYLDFTKEVLN